MLHFNTDILLQNQGNYHPPETLPQVQYPQPENSGYGNNTSLEETWMDLVNILELPSNESNVGMVNNLTGTGRMMSPQNHSNALIQNVTMPTPINNTVTTNTFEPRKPCSVFQGSFNFFFYIITIFTLLINSETSESSVS